MPGRLWLAERKGMSWLMLPFAAANLWGTGLTLLAFYAGAQLLLGPAPRPCRRRPRAAQD